MSEIGHFFKCLSNDSFKDHFSIWDEKKWDAPEIGWIKENLRCIIAPYYGFSSGNTLDGNNHTLYLMGT